MCSSPNLCICFLSSGCASVFVLSRRFGEDSAAIFPSVIRFFFEDSDDFLRARARVTDFTEICTTTMVDISVDGYVWVSAGARGHLGKTAHRVTGKYVEQAHVLLQADTKLGKDALETMKLIGAKGVDSPRVRRNEEQTAQIENSEKLTSAESTLYRSLVMKLAYVAQDRVDIAEAVKCLTRHMWYWRTSETLADTTLMAA